VRIEKAISFITNLPNKQVKVKTIADHVCLSESRLRHLFKEQVGQPIQNFILWMKVVDSLNLILKGAQITKTAHETGFWDSSHMNRSYRELLGATPGAIKKYEHDIRVVSCGYKNLYTIKTAILKNWNDNQPIKTIQL
jgi:AraC-like DNA-binding protein